MDQFITAVLKEIPVLGAFIVVLVIFFRRMDRRDQMHENTIKTMSEAFERSSDKSSAALIQSAVSMNRIASAVDDLKVRL